MDVKHHVHLLIYNGVDYLGTNRQITRKQTMKEMKIDLDSAYHLSGEDVQRRTRS